MVGRKGREAQQGQCCQVGRSGGRQTAAATVRSLSPQFVRIDIFVFLQSSCKVAEHVWILQREKLRQKGPQARRQVLCACRHRAEVVDRDQAA